MSDIAYVTGGVELLDRVGPLWEELNRHHQHLSPHFAASFEGQTFANRRAGLVQKVATGLLRVDLATDASGRDIGYGISTIDEKARGEIESIYVEEGRRSHGIGRELMRRALAWMDEHAVQERYVFVAAGNEQAVSFYARFGFYPRSTRLQYKPPNDLVEPFVPLRG